MKGWHGAAAPEIKKPAGTLASLVVNLKSAGVLGLEISPTMLVRADEVIE